MTIRKWIQTTYPILERAGVSAARDELWLWLSLVTGKDRSYFSSRQNESIHDLLSNDARRSLEDILLRRLEREPLAYIRGSQEFWKRSFLVGRGVLIPRQDSERVIEAALSILGLKRFPDLEPYALMSDHSHIRFMDLCTGTGCLGISLAEELLHRNILFSGLLTDISDDALYYARRNIYDSPAKDRIQVVRADLFPSQDEAGDILEKNRVHLIMANPPYIAAQEMEELMPEVKAYEPTIALAGGEDGLTYYREILKRTDRYLLPGGYLIFEHGYDQGESVPELCREYGFDAVYSLRDYGGQPRVTVAGHNHPDDLLSTEE